MAQTKQRDEIDEMFWREVSAEGASKACGHAWVDFKRTPAGTPAGAVVTVNGVDALRLSIKYRENGPYLCVEQAPGSAETMGSCIRTAAMVKHYAAILDAHNKTGEYLHSARMFIITDEERALAKLPDGDA